MFTGEIRQLWMLVLAITCYSCVLGVEEDNFITIEPVPDIDNLAEIVVSHDPWRTNQQFYPVEDTIWMTNDYQLQVRLPGEKLYAFEALLDYTLLDKREKPDFMGFGVDGDKLSEGAHRLTVVQYVNSGTGSLADKFGVELAEFRRDIVLMVGPITFDPDLSVSFSNGEATISWKKYPRADFHAYKLSMIGYDPVSGGFIDVVTLRDRSQTSVKDPYFVGNNIKYTLEIDRGGVLITSPEVVFNAAYDPELEISEVEGGGTLISWKGPPFLENVASFSVRVNNPVVVENLPYSQTSYTLAESSRFGVKNRYTLEILSKPDDRGRQSRSSYTSSLSVGKRLPNMNAVVYDPNENVYYSFGLTLEPATGTQSHIFCKYDGELEVIAESNFSDPWHTMYGGVVRLAISPDGANLFLKYDHEILKIDRGSMEVINRYTIPSFQQSNYQIDQFFSVSNNGFVSFTSSERVFVLDYTNKAIMFSEPFESAYHIDPAGEYFVSQNKVFRYAAPNYTLYRTLPYEGIKFVSFPSSGGLLITTDAGVYIYDHLAGSEVRFLEFATDRIEYGMAPIYFEESTDKLAFGPFGGFEVKILDLTSGGNQTYNYGTFRLAGEYFFDLNSYTMPSFAIKAH